MPPSRRRNSPVALSTPDAPPPTLSTPDAPPAPPAAGAPTPIRRKKSAAPASPSKPAESAPPAAEAKAVYRQRSVLLEQKLWERARAAVAYIKYFEVEDEPDTLAALISSGLAEKVLDLEDRLNDGEPFRPAGKKLPTGPGRAGVRRLQDRGSS